MKRAQVSLVACDTFRAGAVEQLRTHSKCLGVDLFEQGYDKDAAFVAQAGIRAARAGGTLIGPSYSHTSARRAIHFVFCFENFSPTPGSDVVLIDTAGRMQNNENLMKALSKLIHINTPDLVRRQFFYSSFCDLLFFYLSSLCMNILLTFIGLVSSSSPGALCWRGAGGQ